MEGSDTNKDFLVMSNLNDANLGQLNAPEKQELLTPIDQFRRQDIFPADPNKIRACDQGKTRFRQKDERCNPVAAKQGRFSPTATEEIKRE